MNRWTAWAAAALTRAERGHYGRSLLPDQARTATVQRSLRREVRVTDQVDPSARTRVSTTGDDAHTRHPTARPPGSAGFGPPSDAPLTFIDEPGLLPPGTILNNTQRIEALIGRGGMGEVYRATNVHTGDQDAIKMIRSDLVSDPQVRELFRREAGVLRKVRHPAVVSYEGVFGDDAGRLFLVMEFVDGPSLAKILGRAPLPPADVRRIGVQIAQGLAAAHARGVVHRDLSPDNVVLRGGDLNHAVLIDFGVAKRLDAGASTVIGSGFAGKLDYCSPEQCGLFGGVVDHRTDIYSLGLVLVAAAIGKPLPMGVSMARAVKAREVRPDLSVVHESLRRDLQRLLEPDPARRPQSMHEVAALLAHDAQPRAAARTVTASPARRLAWIGGGLVAMLVMAAAGAILGPRLLGPHTRDVAAPADRAGAVNAEPRQPAGATRQNDDAEQRMAESKRQEAERTAAERKRLEDEARRKAEADRLAAEDAERKATAERQATEEARRKDEAQREAERAAAEAARRKAEDDTRREAEQAAAEAARRKAEDDARRREAERVAAEATRRKAEDDARRETERAAAEAARRKAEDDARREAEQAAAERRRAQVEAQRKAEEERRQQAATPPPSPPTQRAPQQQATRVPAPAPAPAPVPANAEGAWRGTICFRYVMLSQGSETCGPMSLQVAGGAASGSWVINSVTYGISGTISGDAGRVTLDMPPAGRNPSLGSKTTVTIRATANSLQGNGRTFNDVLIMFNAMR